MYTIIVNLSENVNIRKMHTITYNKLTQNIFAVDMRPKTGVQKFQRLEK